MCPMLGSVYTSTTSPAAKVAVSHTFEPMIATQCSLVVDRVVEDNVPSPSSAEDRCRGTPGRFPGHFRRVRGGDNPCHQGYMAVLLIGELWSIYSIALSHPLMTHLPRCRKQYEPLAEILNRVEKTRSTLECCCWLLYAIYR